MAAHRKNDCRLRCFALLAAACVPVDAPFCSAAEMLDLSGVILTVGDARAADVANREIPACVGLTDGEDEAFDQGPFSIIPVTLKAKKAGILVLVPELFLIRDGGLYGVFRICHGIRIVHPRPNPRVESFHPPSDGRRWPGHAGRIKCHAGDTVKVELLFKQLVRADARILAAAPVATLEGAESRDAKATK